MAFVVKQKGEISLSRILLDNSFLKPGQMFISIHNEAVSCFVIYVGPKWTQVNIYLL